MRAAQFFAGILIEWKIQQSAFRGNAKGINKNEKRIKTVT